jgi:hypothetical protein
MMLLLCNDAWRPGQFAGTPQSLQFPTQGIFLDQKQVEIAVFSLGVGVNRMGL